MSPPALFFGGRRRAAAASRRRAPWPALPRLLAVRFKTGQVNLIGPQSFICGTASNIFFWVCFPASTPLLFLPPSLSLSFLSLSSCCRPQTTTSPSLEPPRLQAPPPRVTARAGPARGSNSWGMSQLGLTRRGWGTSQPSPALPPPLPSSHSLRCLALAPGMVIRVNLSDIPAEGGSQASVSQAASDSACKAQLAGASLTTRHCEGHHQPRKTWRPGPLRVQVSIHRRRTFSRKARRPGRELNMVARAANECVEAQGPALQRSALISLTRVLSLAPQRLAVTPQGVPLPHVWGAPQGLPSKTDSVVPP